MIDRLRNPNKRLVGTGVLIAAIGGSALAQGCGASKPQEVVTKTVMQEPPARPEVGKIPELKIEEVKGLAVGEKITKIPIFRPEPNETRSSTYKADPDVSTQDLVLVYSERLNEFMANDVGLDPDKDGAGFLLTKFPAGVMVSLVLFDRPSNEVIDIYPSSELTDGKQRLYKDAYSPETLGFKVHVKPLGEDGLGGVKLYLSDTPGVGDTQPIPHIEGAQTS